MKLVAIAAYVAEMPFLVQTAMAAEDGSPQTPNDTFNVP